MRNSFLNALARLRTSMLRAFAVMLLLLAAAATTTTTVDAARGPSKIGKAVTGAVSSASKAASKKFKNKLYSKAFSNATAGKLVKVLDLPTVDETKVPDGRHVHLGQLSRTFRSPIYVGYVSRTEYVELEADELTRLLELAGFDSVKELEEHLAEQRKTDTSQQTAASGAPAHQALSAQASDVTAPSGGSNIILYAALTGLLIFAGAVVTLILRRNRENEPPAGAVMAAVAGSRVEPAAEPARAAQAAPLAPPRAPRMATPAVAAPAAAAPAVAAPTATVAAPAATGVTPTRQPRIAAMLAPRPAAAAAPVAPSRPAVSAPLPARAPAAAPAPAPARSTAAPAQTAPASTITVRRPRDLSQLTRKPAIAR